MRRDGLLHLCTATIKPEWIDYNGHMNVAYYMLVFDAGGDALLDYLGLDEAYRERSRTSTYVLEAHINYERELLVDALVDIYLQLVDHDAKRVHYVLTMQHREEDFRAATCEIMLMQIDMRTTRGTAMPEFALDRLAALAAEQSDLAPPANLGSVIGIRRKS